MLCNKCGKDNKTNDEFCEECKSQSTNNEFQTNNDKIKSYKKRGLKLAISCFVVSLISLAVVIVAFAFLFPIMIEIARHGYTEDSILHLTIYWIATLILICVSIFTLVLGVMAVKSFTVAKANKEETRPIILVFGIISIAISIFVLIYAMVLMMFPIFMLITRIIPTVTINGKPI